MSDGVQLRVMTYNVRSLRGDLTALGTVVRDVAPDVAILQEGPRRLRWRQRCAKLARSTGMYFAAGGMPALGNVLMTTMRVGVHGVWCMRFPLTPGRHMRGAVVASCSVGRARFVVAGSHLSLESAERPSQALLLKNRLAGAEEPVLVGGDLNENSGGAAWRILADGMSDPAIATGQGQNGTVVRGAGAERVDAVFVDPRCDILDYRVVDRPEYRSDQGHLPVVVDLVVPG